ncbi:hypothetical protein [Mesoplasma coleopterae]|uniref:hypothetical protein n=1 Tax=Mesoplasma coleopterae TaxID=324078 RepID=UPI000D026034|nr:hypothetical protein [Mesoplasma coleopterae]AVN63009.1 hypothetical protein CG000_01675 [Mesoplasma coleopterae]
MNIKKWKRKKEKYKMRANTNNLKLKELFSDYFLTKEFKEIISNIEDGKKFEKKLLEIFKNTEYVQLSAKNFAKNENFKEVKKAINKIYSTSGSIKLNKQIKFKESKFFVYQPFNSQSSPDFLFYNFGKFFPLEAKFTSKKIKSPVWNSGLPKTHFNYIFGSKGKKDLTFFTGKDFIDKKQYDQVIKLVNKKRKELEKEGKKINSEFSLYLRPMYNQKTNFWKYKLRETNEKKLIQLIKEFDS